MTTGLPPSSDSSGAPLALCEYDEVFLDLSWHWLQDPETRALTMAPAFTRAEQRKFFESLPQRSGYRIWGVRLGERRIGAAGLKNFRGGVAEYWGYIGEKDCWGRGHGRDLLRNVEQQARAAGLQALDLWVSCDNARAIRLYRGAGYVTDPHASTEEKMRMVKESLA